MRLLMIHFNETSTQAFLRISDWSGKKGLLEIPAGEACTSWFGNAYRGGRSVIVFG